VNEVVNKLYKVQYMVKLFVLQISVYLKFAIKSTYLYGVEKRMDGK